MGTAEAGAPNHTERSARATGNIQVVNDLYAAYPTSYNSVALIPHKAFAPQWCTAAATAGSHGASAGGAYDNNDIVMAVAHIRVGIATNGSDNVFKIWLPNCSFNDPTSTARLWSILHRDCGVQFVG